MLKSKEHIILETVIFYGQDPSRRSTGILNDPTEGMGAMCLYNGSDGRQCAFARCVKPEHQKKLTESHSAGRIMNNNEEDLLKPEYSYPNTTPTRSFWNGLQTFHDRPDHWDHENKGLTPLGIEYAASLIEYAQK